MVIGLIQSTDHAAVCLSNLIEEGFGPADISVIMKTQTDANAIATVSGSLNGLAPADLTARLVGLGLPQAVAEEYQRGARDGGVVIAISAGDAAAAAAETLQDHGAVAVRTLPDG